MRAGMRSTCSNPGFQISEPYPKIQRSSGVLSNSASRFGLIAAARFYEAVRVTGRESRCNRLDTARKPRKTEYPLKRRIRSASTGPMSQYDYSPRRRRWPLVLLILIAVLAGLWCGGWYVAAGKVEELANAWKEREAKAGR